MKLYTILEEQLKKEPNFVSDDGELKKWVVLNKAQNCAEPFQNKNIQIGFSNSVLQTG